jgi:hypothetical protein
MTYTVDDIPSMNIDPGACTCKVTIYMFRTELATCQTTWSNKYVLTMTYCCWKCNIEEYY